MTKAIVLFVSLISISFAGGIKGGGAFHGKYVNKNGAEMTISPYKGEYGLDTMVEFKRGECQVEWSIVLKDNAKGRGLNVVDDQGYGPLLYFKGTFDAKGADMVVTNKFMTDNGCEYGIDHKLLSGRYTRR